MASPCFGFTRSSSTARSSRNRADFDPAWLETAAALNLLRLAALLLDAELGRRARMSSGPWIAEPG